MVAQSSLAQSRWQSRQSSLVQVVVQIVQSSLVQISSRRQMLAGERGLGLGQRCTSGAQAQGGSIQKAMHEALQAASHGTRHHHMVPGNITMSCTISYHYHYAMYTITLYYSSHAISPCYIMSHYIFHAMAYITLYIPCHGLYHHVEHSDGLALKQSVYLALLRPFTQNCRKRQPFARTHGRFGHAHSATTVGSWCV